jgi:hypothetical protein
MTCKYCKGTGRMPMFNGDAPCVCQDVKIDIKATETATDSFAKLNKALETLKNIAGTAVASAKARSLSGAVGGYAPGGPVVRRTMPVRAQSVLQTMDIHEMVNGVFGGVILTVPLRFDPSGPGDYRLFFDLSQVLAITCPNGRKATLTEVMFSHSRWNDGKKPGDDLLWPKNIRTGIEKAIGARPDNMRCVYGQISMDLATRDIRMRVGLGLGGTKGYSTGPGASIQVPRSDFSTGMQDKLRWLVELWNLDALMTEEIVLV